MNSSPTVAVGVFAGVLATSVAAVAIKVRRWERDLEKRWEAYSAQKSAAKPVAPSFKAPEVTIDLPLDQPLEIEFLQKPSPIFFVHQT